VATGRRREAETRRVAQELVGLLDSLPDLALSKRDSSLVGDLASLYMWCGRLRDEVDSLLRTARRRGSLQSLPHEVGRLWAEVGSLRLYHEHLEGPLDRLHSQLLGLARREERKERKGRLSSRRARRART